MAKKAAKKQTRKSAGKAKRKIAQQTATDEPSGGAAQVDDAQADDGHTEPGTGVGGSLGAFIRAQREMANLSLRQLSAMTEISNAYLSQIERDLHEPSIRILNNVGKALGISPDVLLTRAGFAKPDDDEVTLQPTVTTEEAIQADPHLSPDEKQALLTVYRSYRSAKG